jgi:hypothetical protein
MTLIAIITGVLMLWVFKHTSHQGAIQQARNQIKANLLALSLFQDDVRVSLRSQARLACGVGWLFALSLVPMLVMLVPMGLLLGQLALWYQARPLGVGDEAIVTAQLNEACDNAVSGIRLQPSSAAKVVAGPVRVPGKHQVCWNIQATEPGRHDLSFTVGNLIVAKELAVGSQFMPVSRKRPAWSWSDALLHPRERPLAGDSPVRSIEIAYGERSSWVSGSHSWLVYWFVVSMAAAFAARPLLKVNI